MSLVSRAAISVVILGGVATGYTVWKRGAAAAARVEYRSAPAGEQTVVKSVSASGILQPFRTIDVKSKAGGRVVELKVEPGDLIKPGQLIARIDPVDMKANYDAAKAAEDVDIAHERQAEQSLIMQKRVNPAQLAQSLESLNASRAKLKQADESLDYQKQLSTAQVTEAQQAIETARIRMLQAQKQAEAQPKLSETSIAEAEASLQDSQETVRQMKEATHPQQLALAQSTLDQAKSNLSNAESNLKRMNDLVAQGFASQKGVEDAQTQRDNARAALSTASKKIETVKSEQDAELRAVEARVRRARATLDNVKANAVQVELRKHDLEAARSALKQVEASLMTAQANAVQNRVRQQDVEAARAAVRQADAALKLTEANLMQERLRQEDVRAAKAQIVRSNVQTRNADVNLKETTIVAPSEGWAPDTEFVVTKKYIDQGTIIPSATSPVATGVAIVQIADRSKMFVDAQVDEASVASVSTGQEVDITLDAFPNTPYSGKVKRVDPQAEVVQNVTYIHVQVEILDADARLKPAMNATCEFIVDRKKNVLAVPSEAVKEAQDGSKYVEVLDPKKSPEPERVTIETGIEGMTYTEITGGKLKKNMNVVTATIQPSIGAPGAGPSGQSGPPRMPRSMGGGR